MPGDGRDGGDGAIGEGVGQRTETDHAEELEAVVLEDEGEGGELLVLLGHVGDEVLEEGAGDDEGDGAADDGR